jgi:hypothetical protein
VRRFVVFPAQPNDVHRPVIIRVMTVDLFGAAHAARLALDQTAAKRRL